MVGMVVSIDDIPYLDPNLVFDEIADGKRFLRQCQSVDNDSPLWSSHYPGGDQCVDFTLKPIYVFGYAFLRACDKSQPELSN